MHRPMTLRDEKGFTLFESITHLIIFTMLIQLTVLFFFWRAPVQSSYQEDFQAEWELFSMELQELLEEVQTMAVTGSCEIVFATERGSIKIQSYNEMLRKLVDNKGHVPLLTNVASCRFTRSGDQLQLIIEKTNGIKKERTFAIGLPAQ